MSSKFLDKTGLDTLWAKIKSTFQTLGNLVTSWDSTPSDSKYPSEKLVKTSLDGKVNKETGKGLSTNDFTDAYKSNVDSNTSARHTHSNKSVLDGISSTDVANWDGKQDILLVEVEYGVTTRDEVVAILDAGKVPYLSVPNEYGVYIFGYKENGLYYFSRVSYQYNISHDEPRIDYAYVDGDDNWSTFTSYLQHKITGNAPDGDTTKFLNAAGQWATPAESGVTGVKGYAESSYRTGNVDLTSENIGLGTLHNLASTQAIQFSFAAKTSYGSIKFFTSIDSYVIEFTVTFEVDMYGSISNSISVTMVSCRYSGQTLSSSNFVPTVKYLSGDFENDVPAKLWIYFGSGNYKRIRWIAAANNYTQITSSLVTIASIDSSATMVASTRYSYMPLVTGGYNKAVGSDTNPVYVNDAGLVNACDENGTANAMLNSLTTGSSTPVDADYFISQFVGGGTTTTTFHRRPVSALWNYIKTQIYNGSLGSENRPVFWTGSNLSLTKPSPNANLMGTVGKTTAAAARADTAQLENTTINCNNGTYYYLNAIKFIPNVPYTFMIPSVNGNKSGLVASTAMTVYQIGASSFTLGTSATLYLDKAGGTSAQHEIVFVYRVGTTLYIFHQY